jgi:hypothetical protein
MALKYIDGFDTYHDAATIGFNNAWTGLNTILFDKGRYSGNAMSVKAAKLQIPSANVYYIGFAMKNNSDAYSVIFNDSNGASAVSFHMIPSAGSIQARAYTDGSTLNYNTIASSTSGLFSTGTWDYYEFRVTLNSSTGIMQARVNGTQVLNLSSINTMQWAGLTSNIAQIYWFGNANQIGYMDDLYVNDSTTGAGTYPNNSFIGDKRITTLYPNAIDSVDFTDSTDFNFSPLAWYNGYSSTTTNGTYSLLANKVYVGYLSTPSPNSIWYLQGMNYLPTQDCSITEVTLSVSTLTPSAKIKAMIYADDGAATGNPSTLLGTSDELTGLAAGVNTLTFSTPVAISKDTPIYVGFLADSNITVDQWYKLGSTMSPTMQNLLGRTSLLFKTYTYGAPPTTFDWATATSYDNVFLISITATITNLGAVQETYPDGDTTYNESNVATDVDLFTTDGTIAGSAIIYGVQVSGVYKKDDAGTRTVCNVLKSSATQSDGATNSLTASYKTYNDVYAVDPNTSASWTVANCNSAKIGYKVVA